MITADPVLPAVAQLTGDDAAAVLRPAIEAAGGQLNSARCSHVHYVPGRELVVRYRCDIHWPGKHSPRDTILAATTTSGVLPGTVPVVADDDGRPIEVSVWRWPFDPLVPASATAVTASSIRDALGAEVTGRVNVDVLAYRPTDRIVTRVTDEAGRVLYVKALRQGVAGDLANRHRQLIAAGVPAAPVVKADDDGLLVLEELAGTTLRERVKGRIHPWPEPRAITELCNRISKVEASSPPTRASRTRDAVAHLEMLARVMPSQSWMLSELSERFEKAIPASAARSNVVIHSDLHEAQLIVNDDGEITGLLDVDDLAVGDPLDDPAALIAHLRYRSITVDDRAHGAEIRQYADELRAHFADLHDPVALDLTIAAAMVGLATGPFRIQLANWPQITAECLADAARLASADVASVR